MAALGHRHILHISGPDHHPASVERRRVFLDTVGRLELASEGPTQAPCDGAYAAEVVRGLPESTPVTAVIAGNDELAAGVIAVVNPRAL